MRDTDWNRLIRQGAEATAPRYSGGYLVSTEVIDEVDAELRYESQEAEEVNDE